MLKVLSELQIWRDSRACHVGADILLRLWQESLTRHPYMFYMGTDFRKLKVPFIWYDLVHVLDVLSRFPWLRNDARLIDMLASPEEQNGSAGTLHPRIGLDGLEGLGIWAEKRAVPFSDAGRVANYRQGRSRVVVTVQSADQKTHFICNGTG